MHCNDIAATNGPPSQPSKFSLTKFHLNPNVRTKSGTRFHFKHKRGCTISPEVTWISKLGYIHLFYLFRTDHIFWVTNISLSILINTLFNTIYRALKMLYKLCELVVYSILVRLLNKGIEICCQNSNTSSGYQGKATGFCHLL
jgi:hypothetical protein